MPAGGEAESRPILMPLASMSCEMSSKMASCCFPFHYSCVPGERGGVL
jgi:hypothetical protein